MSLDKYYLRECFSYDGSTGDLTWLERPLSHFSTKAAMIRFNARFAGVVAGSLSHTSSGGMDGKYFNVSVKNVRYSVHRIVWIWFYGVWPKGHIDHINGNGLDNRISNLRDVNPKENHRNRKRNKNNTSGSQGVYWRKDISKWMVTVPTNEGKRKSLGFFIAKKDAIKARKDWESLNGYGPVAGL